MSSRSPSPDADARSGRRRSGRGWRSPRPARARSRPGGRSPSAAARSPRPCRRASRSARSSCRTPRATPGSMPSWPASSRGHAEAQPVERLGARQPDLLRVLERGGVAGVAADHVAVEQGGVGHVAGERAALVERRGERDHPVARDAAVGRLQPDDPGTARPAGGSSRRCRCRSPTARGPPPPPPPSRRSSRPARARGPTGSSPGRSPSSRSTSPSRTRPCWSCRASARPRPARFAHGGGRVRRPVALEDARAGGARHVLDAEEVLHGERDAGERALAAVRARPRHPQEGAKLLGRRALAVEARTARRRRARPARDLLGGLRGRERRSRCSRHGLGTRKPSSVASGAFASARSRGRHGRGSSGRSTFSRSTTCEVGSTPSRSSSPICSMCLEDRRQLAGHLLDLLVGEPQPGEPGDVEDLLAIDHGAMIGTRVMNHVFAGIPVRDAARRTRLVGAPARPPAGHASERQRGLLATDRQQLDLRRRGREAGRERRSSPCSSTTCRASSPGSAARGIAVGERRGSPARSPAATSARLGRKSRRVLGRLVAPMRSPLASPPRQRGRGRRAVTRPSADEPERERPTGTTAPASDAPASARSVAAQQAPSTAPTQMASGARRRRPRTSVGGAQPRPRVASAAAASRAIRISRSISALACQAFSPGCRRRRPPLTRAGGLRLRGDPSPGLWRALLADLVVYQSSAITSSRASAATIASRSPRPRRVNVIRRRRTVAARLRRRQRRDLDARGLAARGKLWSPMLRQPRARQHPEAATPSPTEPELAAVGAARQRQRPDDTTAAAAKATGTVSAADRLAAQPASAGSRHHRQRDAEQPGDAAGDVGDRERLPARSRSRRPRPSTSRGTARRAARRPETPAIHSPCLTLRRSTAPAG